MKKSLLFALAIALGLNSYAQNIRPEFKSQGLAGNPVIEGWYADPEGIIYGDEYWIFPTWSDEWKQYTPSKLTATQKELQKNTINPQYLKQTYLDAFSSKDLITWTKHPRVLDVENISWAAYSIWAPSVIHTNNLYYLFFGANDIQSNNEKGGIGVAVANQPEGPYRDAIGKPLINSFHNGAQPIDQFVFKDDDGQFYLYYGGWRHCNVVRLKPDLLSLDTWPDGETYKEITPENYVEGPFVFKRNSKYYLMWSEGGWMGPDYSVAYAIGETPLGPFKRIGKILKQNPEVARGAGHHSVMHIPGSDDYYMVYHRRPLDTQNGHHREVCIDRMYFTADGRIEPVDITFEGVKSRTVNPFPAGNARKEGLVPQRINRIDQMIQESVNQSEIPGAVALIARNGKVVFHKAYGWADVPAGKKMEKDAIFRIASQSKAITSTAVMMLWEEGLFRLDDPISKYIPEFKNPQVLEKFKDKDSSWTGRPAIREITIRHLLSHTSGIGYGMIDGDERIRKIYQKAGVTDLFTTKPITIEESVKKLAGLPLHHDPGEGYTYSEGLDVLGYFIEIVSGMPFDEFLRTRLFEPMGMTDTWFYLPDDKSDRLVPVQHYTEQGWEHYPVTIYDPDYPKKGAKTFFSGGAGLSSTAEDYAKFLQMYLNGGVFNGHRFLSRHTIRTILSNQFPHIRQGADSFYGLAFGVTTERGEAHGGRGSEGTFDWGGYFNTQYFADPEEGIIGILMKQTQGYNGDETGWKFKQMVFQAIGEW